ncbi:ArsR/SmtB family transcription factor [Ligilactobacillus cholophilus]|uniref:ArsR/SmtB family transcription factor n=1 Tax=Ligilactobacillus cholophilus TaxID=3050131 RepID=UPI0025B24708|nr:metalloregulator ArsR/SmtB family transcription factor [Ligilactobacillus cholophilus]
MAERSKLILPTPSETDQSVQIFKAFGDQTRYRILFLLFEHKLSVNEIANLIGISQSAVSHQLKILRQTNLVIGKREGQSIIYELADRHIINIFKQVKEHIAED